MATTRQGPSSVAAPPERDIGSGKRRIVILCSSLGGTNAARRLRRKLGERADLTLISAEPHFTFIPSLPWVMIRWQRPECLRVPLPQEDEAGLAVAALRVVRGPA